MLSVLSNLGMIKLTKLSSHLSK